jgi:hypothetical protein
VITANLIFGKILLALEFLPIAKNTAFSPAVSPLAKNTILVALERSTPLLFLKTTPAIPFDPFA